MNVFIITEGNAQTGYGHLTRCLAIYQGFEEHGIRPTIIANCDENGEIVLGDVPLQVFNWVENSSKILDIVTGAEIAIIDSYLATESFYEKLYRVVKKAVYIDDTLRLDYPPGVILNGAVGAENLPYKKSEKHTYFLGLKFAPLRKEFWDLPGRDFLDMRNNVLITIGYSFSDEHINNLIYQALTIPTFRLVIVGNKDVANIKKLYELNDPRIWIIGEEEKWADGKLSETPVHFFSRIVEELLPEIDGQGEIEKSIDAVKTLFSSKSE